MARPSWRAIILCYSCFMKIVLAASIFPPEIGGPATYAAALKSAFERMDHHVELLVFSRYGRYPSGVRHLRYALDLFRISRDADLVIAFDTITTGLPAAIVHKATSVPTVARIGGDFIWERYIERTGDLCPLPHFYEAKEKWNVKDRFLMRLIEFVLETIEVVFSSSWQRDIWKRFYELDLSRVHVIENEMAHPEVGISPTEKNFLHYGRRIALKNSSALQDAFSRVRSTHPAITLEEGTLSRGELLDRIKRCYAVVLPSISDVTPNLILEGMRFGKPFLLTKYSGYAEQFANCGVIVDPLDTSSIAKGIERLLDPEEYRRMCEHIKARKDVHSYDDIAREFLALATV
jgi:glycosyltransferase involved in cell wall biosynthesis